MALLPTSDISVCPQVKPALLRSAGPFLQALPEGPGAPHGPEDGLAAAHLLHHPLLITLPPSSLFLPDRGPWVHGPSEQRPETLPECAERMCLMDVLILVFAGQMLGGAIRMPSAIWGSQLAF